MARTFLDANQVPPKIIKPSDTSRASTIVLTADPHLVLPNLLANASYWVRVSLGIQGTAATAGIQISWTLPAGSLFQGHWVSSAVNNSVVIQNSASFVGIISVANMKARQILTGNFFVNIGGTAGSLTMNWAQITSNAAATIVQGGSFIDSIKVL